MYGLLLLLLMLVALTVAAVLLYVSVCVCFYFGCFRIRAFHIYLCVVFGLTIAIV